MEGRAVGSGGVWLVAAPCLLSVVHALPLQAYPIGPAPYDSDSDSEYYVHPAEELQNRMSLPASLCHQRAVPWVDMFFGNRILLHVLCGVIVILCARCCCAPTRRQRVESINIINNNTSWQRKLPGRAFIQLLPTEHSYHLGFAFSEASFEAGKGTGYQPFISGSGLKRVKTFIAKSESESECCNVLYDMNHVAVGAAGEVPVSYSGLCWTRPSFVSLALVPCGSFRVKANMPGLSSLLAVFTSVKVIFPDGGRSTLPSGLAVTGPGGALVVVSGVPGLLAGWDAPHTSDRRIGRLVVPPSRPPMRTPVAPPAGGTP
eukprot:355617-Chlamydomonas_euryale.AAC.3